MAANVVMFRNGSFAGDRRVVLVPYGYAWYQAKSKELGGKTTQAFELYHEVHGGDKEKNRVDFFTSTSNLRECFEAKVKGRMSACGGKAPCECCFCLGCKKGRVSPMALPPSVPAVEERFEAAAEVFSFDEEESDESDETEDEEGGDSDYDPNDKGAKVSGWAAAL